MQVLRSGELEPSHIALDDADGFNVERMVPHCAYWSVSPSIIRFTVVRATLVAISGASCSSWYLRYLEY